MNSIAITPGQKRSIDALIEAGTLAGAAQILGVKRSTVDSHLKEVRKRLKVHNSLHMVIAYLNLESVEVPNVVLDKFSKFYDDNPDEELTYEDMHLKFGFSEATCRKAVRVLGLVSRKLGREDGEIGRCKFAFSRRVE